MTEHSNGAHILEGRKLKSGWEVLKKIEKTPGHTGSFFSVLYHVKKGYETCFLKAFDFSKFSTLKHGESLVDTMSYMLDAYKFERDLSKKCMDNGITKVAFVKDSGEEPVFGFEIPMVPYLIFDLAEGDVRSKLKFSADLDFSWKLKSLHDIAVGMQQLHKINISHQDIKPSNVLVFDKESKIGDLGRSICKDLIAPHDGLAFSGQRSYAPPEIMYGIYSTDWHKRSYAIDSYLFGGLIVFYFSGVSINSLIRQHLPDSVSWEYWRGTDFNEVKDYLMNAFQNALDEFSKSIDDNYFKLELRQIVEQLCFPIPELRGHPKNVSSIHNNYNFERFISKLDLLYRKSYYTLLKK